MNAIENRNQNDISDFDELESKLEESLAAQLEGLEVLEKEREKINNESVRILQVIEYQLLTSLRFDL